MSGERKKHGKAPQIRGPQTLPIVFVVPDRPHEQGAIPQFGTGDVVVAMPPFSLFCGRLREEPNGLDRHGLWVTHRPSVRLRDTADPEHDWLLVDFGLGLVAPEWRQAQEQFEMLLLQTVALHLANGYRHVNLAETLNTLLKPGAPGN